MWFLFSIWMNLNKKKWKHEEFKFIESENFDNQWMDEECDHGLMSIRNLVNLIVEWIETVAWIYHQFNFLMTHKYYILVTLWSIHGLTIGFDFLDFFFSVRIGKNIQMNDIVWTKFSNYFLQLNAPWNIKQNSKVCNTNKILGINSLFFQFITTWWQLIRNGWK